MRILVLSVTAGQGHNSCGKAVMEACVQRGVDSIMIDTLLQTSRFVANSLNSVYIKMIRYTPGLLKQMNDGMLKEKRVRSRRGTEKLIGIWFQREICKIIEEYRPDAIVCTHVFASTVVSHIRKNRGLEIPVVGVNTDFALLPMWEDCDLDLYVVAAEEMRNAVSKRGIPTERILCTGIPVSARFSKKMDKADARRELGIQDRSTVLIMSGSMGFGKLPEIVRAIDRLPMDLQMLVVCGNNRKMYQKVREIKTEKTTHVYGFVNNVEVMMDAADLLLTKPGGLTASECLAKRVPMILLDPIPGWEESNCLFLTAQGAAVLAANGYAPDDAVMNLLSDPERLAQIDRMQEKIGKPNAAVDLVDAIMDLVARRSGERALE